MVELSVAKPAYATSRSGARAPAPTLRGGRGCAGAGCLGGERMTVSFDFEEWQSRTLRTARANISVGHRDAATSRRAHRRPLSAPRTTTGRHARVVIVSQAFASRAFGGSLGKHIHRVRCDVGSRFTRGAGTPCSLDIVGNVRPDSVRDDAQPIYQPTAVRAAPAGHAIAPGPDRSAITRACQGLRSYAAC